MKGSSQVVEAWEWPCQKVKVQGRLVRQQPWFFKERVFKVAATLSNRQLLREGADLAVTA
ncbi:hypothetical protein GCM10020218_103800 [Dactylosporangium vinaceum]